MLFVLYFLDLTVYQKTYFHKTEEIQNLHSQCGVEVKSMGKTTCTTVFISKYIRLTFRVRNYNSSVFPTKTYEIHGNQFVLPEIVNLNHSEIHYIYQN